MESHDAPLPAQTAIGRVSPHELSTDDRGRCQCVRGSAPGCYKIRSEVTLLCLACRTVRQAGRLPELAMTTGKMGLNPTELVDRTADPTVSQVIANAAALTNKGFPRETNSA